MRVESLPFTFDPDEQHHVANLCLGLAAVDPDIEFSRFRRTLVRRGRAPSIVHVHWPEHVLDNRSVTRHARAARQLMALAVRRRAGAVLVHTAHNAAPHDLQLSRLDRWYLRSFDRMVDLVLVTSLAGSVDLLAARPELGRARMVHVRLGLPMSPVPAAIDRPAAVRRWNLDPDRPVVAFVGRVMRYKGIATLIDAWDAERSQLLVAGAASDADLERTLTDGVGDRPGAALVFRHLDEDELIDAVGAASVVVLPFLKVLNSGSVLLALSLGRRVLVPDTATFRELRAEIGDEWIRIFDGERPSSDDLDVALVDPPTGRPDLTEYDWPAVASRTYAAYRMAIADRHR